MLGLFLVSLLLAVALAALRSSSTALLLELLASLTNLKPHSSARLLEACVKGRCTSPAAAQHSLQTPLEQLDADNAQSRQSIPHSAPRPIRTAARAAYQSAGRAGMRWSAPASATTASSACCPPY